MILTQIDSSSLLSTSGLTTLVILFMSFAIFGWLVVRYRNIRSFEFQISIFIMVYIIGEIIEDYKDSEGFNYFEITILEKEDSCTNIAIGVATKPFPCYRYIFLYIIYLLLINIVFIIILK